MDFLKELISFCAKKNCALGDLIFPNQGIPRSYEEALIWGGTYFSLFEADPQDLINGYRMNNDQISRALTLWRWKHSREDIHSDLIIESESGNIIAKHQKDVRQTKRILDFFDERDNIVSYFLESYNVVAAFNTSVSLDDIFDTVSVPFAILGNKRRVSTKLEKNNFPSWFLSDTEDSKLLCRIGNFDVKVTPKTFSFRCAKNGYKTASKLLSLLSISEEDCVLSKNNIICVGILNIQNPWKYHIFADIITNDLRVSEIASIIEASKPLYERKYMSFSCIGSRCTISKQEKEVKIRISEVKGRADSSLVMVMVSKIFEIYDERYHEIDLEYKELETSPDISEESSSPKISSIKLLRSEVPDLFIENYTREATILPKIIKKEDVEAYKRVVQYPKGSGKYYTSPDERYTVGLKLNRLKNKEKYPYIVTCYTTDHMKRKGTHTYRYYYGHQEGSKKTKNLEDGQKASLPLPLRGDFGLNKDYVRIGVKDGTFIQCIEHALGKNGIKNKIFKEVMAQEIWNFDIEGEFSGQTDLCFRYFEEKYQCDIFVIELEEEGSYHLGPPRHVVQPYFWKKAYSRGIIILKHVSYLYHETQVFYELITKGSKKVFVNDDPLLSLISEAKSKECSHPGDVPDDAIAQYINERGKCGLIKTKDGMIIPGPGRPLNLPHEHLSHSRIEDFFNNMNKSMKHVGIPERRWRSTSSHDLFFPDKASFEKYTKEITV